MDEWNCLDVFFTRYNRVLLDKVAIESEQKRLSMENEELRLILKQYVDGISVTPESMDVPNSLFVVNNRTNICAPIPAISAGEGYPPSVEATTVVNEMARMN